MIDEPVPSEFCPHIETGAEMTGGWYFAAEDPPRAVGMCHDCIMWCKGNLSAGLIWAQHVEREREDDERVLSAEVVL